MVTRANLNDSNSSNYVARISTDVNSRVWTTAQIPDLATTKISGLQGALDSKQATLTSTNTIGVFNTSHFTNNTGTNKIDLTSSSLSKWTTNSVDATKIYYNGGNVGIGTTNPTSKLHIATPDNTATTTDLLNFKNVTDYGIYATSISIAGRGNTLDFLARDYNGAANTIRNILTLRPEGNVGIGTTDPLTYKLNVTGSINATDYKINGLALNIGLLSQGMTVQTKHLTYTQMDVKNNTGWDAINDDLVNGFVIAITPSSTSSKILVNMIAHIGTNDNTTDSRWWGIKLYRKIGAGAWTEVAGANGTETGAAANTAGTPVWVSHNLGMEGSTNQYQYLVANVTGTYMDAPATTSIVYYTAYWNQKISEVTNSVAANIYINRSHSHGDTNRPATSSSWTVTEIWDLGTPYTPPSGDTTITIASSSVGISATPNANHKLIVNQGTTGGTGVTCFPLKISAGAVTNLGNSTATLIGLGTENNGTLTKCAIGHSRTGTYDVGSIVFLCNNTNDGTMVTMTDERMRITSAGNVGIGTNNPVNILQVGGAGRLRIANNNTDYTMIGSSDVDGSTNTTIVLSGTDRASYNGQIDYVARSTGSHIFYTTASATERMRIASGGNVGIGTNNPTTAKLEVWGNLLMSSTNWVSGANVRILGLNTDKMIEFSFDNGTTIYDNNAIRFRTNGSERMLIASTGAVSIGGTLSAGATTITGNSAVVGTLEVGAATAELLISGNSIVTQGSDANIPLTLQTKGTSSFAINTGATPATRLSITDAGNVGIGTSTTPINLLELTKSSYTGALLSLDAGVVNAGAGVMPQAIGKPLLRLGRGFYSATTGDYYGIGFGWAPLALSNSCCEIGTIITSTAGNETGDIVLSTRTGTTDIPATERMRITSAGNVGIGTTDPSTYKLNVNGSLNVTSLFVGGTAFTGASQWVGTTDIYNITGNVGIGTSTVNERLTIRGTGARLMMLTCTTATYASYMGFSNSANDSLAYIGVDGVGLNGLVYGALTLGTWKDQPILFTTGATNTEKMRIASGGNVGIGTNNPLALLDVVYSPPAVANTDMLNIRVDANWGLKLQQSYTVAGNIQYNFIHRYNSTDYNSLTFKGAYVGIGTASPSNKLHIVHSSTSGNPDTGNIGLYVYNPTNTAGHNSVIINRIAGSAAGKVLYGFDVNAAYGYSIYMLGSSSSLRFNNGWDGTGTDVMQLGNTGNLGIGTTPHATYKLDVNGTINATSVLVGGAAISGSKWTAGATATNIYYSAGNVGIGTSTTSDSDDNASFAIPTAPLFVKGGASAGGTCDVVFRGGAAGSNNGKARLWLAADASHSSYIQSEHTTGGNTTLSFGTSSGNALPTERMKIDQSGNVTCTADTAVNGNLYVGTSGAASTIFLGGGAAGDNDFNMSTIASRNYSGGENTEIIIFKGNDVGTTTVADRIRLRAGAIVFDTFPGASSDRTAENIRMVIDGSGNVGIGNTAPLGPLHIADGTQANNDGHIILARCTTVGSTRMTRLGFNSSFQFCIGDVGGGNALSAWVNSFKMDYTAPANSLYIDSAGSLNVLANVTAYVSDMRLKTKTSDISEPLKIIDKLNGFYYTLNDIAKSFGIKNTRQEIGLSAQEIQKVLPELVHMAPFDKNTDEHGNITSKSGDNYLTISYDRLAPVFVEAIKELNRENKLLKKENNELNEKYNKLLEDIILIKQTLKLV